MRINPATWACRPGYVQPDSADGCTDDQEPKCKPNVGPDGANRCSDGFTDGWADEQ